jgi:hypothetical protein
MELRTAELKKSLRNAPGSTFIVPRGCGKSTAIVEIVHEDRAGNASVVVLNQSLASCFEKHYRNQYPDDAIPKVVSIDGWENRIRGDSRPVYADEARLGGYQNALIDFRGGLTSAE